MANNSDPKKAVKPLPAVPAKNDVPPKN